MGASMRVGIASYGATGHIYPLLSFADVLLAAGHDVIILTGSDLVPWLTGLAYAAEAVGESIGWGVAQVQSRFPELTTSLPADHAWRMDAELFADALPRVMAPALIRAFKPRRPDLVLYESTNLGAVLAAAELSIPAVCLDLWASRRRQHQAAYTPDCMGRSADIAHLLVNPPPQSTRRLPHIRHGRLGNG
jgi:UDP:flavonoid glycosyltransferase YjiC (YdhE family)